VTPLAPGSGEKLSKFTMAAHDVAGMLAPFAELQRKAQARTAQRSTYRLTGRGGEANSLKASSISSAKPETSSPSLRALWRRHDPSGAYLWPSSTNPPCRSMTPQFADKANVNPAAKMLGGEDGSCALKRR
jgi:hypothetical protein